MVYDGDIDYLYPDDWMLILRIPDHGGKSITISKDTQIQDANGIVITLKNLEEGMQVRISGPSVFQGHGLIASSIQILTE